MTQVAKPSRKEQGCKRQAIQSLRSSSMRTNRVETPGGCLCANDDIRPVFGRDRCACDAEERNIKPTDVVAMRFGACVRAVCGVAFGRVLRTGSSAMTRRVDQMCSGETSCRRGGGGGARVYKARRGLSLLLRLEELKFPARWKCCTSTLRVRRITHQVRKVTAKARTAGLFASVAVCRGCLTPTALVSESAGFCLVYQAGLGSL